MARSPAPNGPRTIKVPRPPIFTLPTTVRGWIILVVLGVLLAVGGFAFYKWQSLYFGMPKLPDTAELWPTHRGQSRNMASRRT